MESTYKNETRSIIRKLCYEKLGTTYNEIELFLMNRFPNGGLSYWAEWIDRMTKPNFLSYMDNESKSVWFCVVKIINNFDDLMYVDIEGKPE
jgi:hypothetical protein